MEKTGEQTKNADLGLKSQDLDGGLHAAAGDQPLFCQCEICLAYRKKVRPGTVLREGSPKAVAVQFPPANGIPVDISKAIFGGPVQMPRVLIANDGRPERRKICH